MARSVSLIKQQDAKKLFRAALDAGFPTAIVTYHPDGRVETRASMLVEDIAPTQGKNSWDEVL